MAKNGVFSRLKGLEESEGLEDLSPCFDSHEVHVLAVDDSFVDRKVIERLLKITSCKVTAVDSGRRALQFLGLDKEETPVDFDFDGLKVDLIITDYCMPGMTGYELLKKIKGSSTFKEIPVVIMSSENVLTRIDRCLEEGAEDFIVKPVQLSDVKRLKSYMFGEGGNQRQDGGFHKRKLQETSYVSQFPSPSPSPPLSPPSLDDNSSSPSPSSPPSTDDNSSSPSPPSNSSPSSPRSFSSFPSRQSMPCSPSSLDSPTRRIKLSNHD